MERSVGGHATEASQMCHEGRNRGNITALERHMGNIGGAVQRCAILAGESPARGIVGSPR